MPVMLLLLSLSVKSPVSGAPVISLMFLSPSASMALQCLAMEPHASSVSPQLDTSRLFNLLPVLLVSCVCPRKHETFNIFEELPQNIYSKLLYKVYQVHNLIRD